MKRKLALLMAAVMLLTTPASVSLASDVSDVIIVEDESIETESIVEESELESEIPTEEELIVAVEEADDPSDEPATVSTVASGTCGDNLTWTLDDAGTLTLDGTGEMTDGDESTFGENVPWDSYRNCIINVIIKTGVTHIGNYAFCQCVNLTSVSIPSSVISIGDFAFQYSGLTSVSIPSSVTSIGSYAFQRCGSLTSISIPFGVTKIEEHMFQFCDSLSSVSIPSSVTSIGDFAFQGCSMTSVSIPSSVTSIGVAAFYGCSNLSSINIPSSVTSIGYSAFEKCSSLTSVSIPSGVKFINESTFENCSSLTSVSIPSSVISIGYHAFLGCENLTDVYYAGSEDEWNEIYDGGDTSAIIHYNSTIDSTGESTASSSITFEEITDKISVGDEFIISATITNEDSYSNALPLTWTVSDEDGISLSTPASVIGMDIDGCTAAASLVATAKKAGNYTVTVTTNDGASASLNVLILNGEKNYCGDNVTWEIDSDGTLIISGTGDMYDFESGEAPWSDYDYSSIIVSVIIENGVTSIGNNAFDQLIFSKAYTIGSSVISVGDCSFFPGNSSTKIVFGGDAPQISSSAFGDSSVCYDIYYDSTKSGWSEIIASYKNGHFIYNGTFPQIAWIYTEDAYDKLSVSSMWSFDNASNYFGETYDILDEDWSKLETLGRTSIKAINKGIKENYSDGFGGECYGMSSVLTLVKNGILPLSSVSSSASSLYDVYTTDTGTVSSKLESLIYFYQLQQHIPAVSNVKTSFMKQEQSVQLIELDNIVRDAENNGMVALICFTYRNEEKDNKEGNHAVVGYAVEEGTFIIEINGTSYEFDHRILTYDPAYSGDNQHHYGTSIYYSLESGIFGIPFYKAISTTHDFFVDSSNDNAMLKIVTTDSNYINAVDYRTGEIHTGSVSTNAYLYSASGNVTVNHSTGSFTIENGLIGGTHAIDDSGAIVVGTSTGSSGTSLVTVALPDLTGSYSVESNDSIDSLLVYEDIALDAESDAGGSVYFESDGKVTLSTNRSSTSSISITANDGITASDYHTITVTGGDVTAISTELVDNGIVVASDNMEEITIIAEGDSETKEITVISDSDSILISDDETNNLAVYVDTNQDGTYDTKIEDSNGELILDSDGIYRYYVNGVFDSSFNGIVGYDGGQFFVANGVLCSDAHGLNLYNGTWYFLAYGQVQTQYTGLALYDGEWFYITEGILDTSKTGLIPYDGETFLVSEGHLLTSYNGLWLNAAEIGGDNKWYFIAAGQVQDVSQVVMYDGAFFVVENGILNTSYNGTIEYDGATFTVVNGQLY